MTDTPNDTRIRVNVHLSQSKQPPEDLELEVNSSQTVGETKKQLLQLDQSLEVDKLRLSNDTVADDTTIAELCALHDEPLVFTAQRRTLEVSVKRRKRCSGKNCSSAPLRGVGDCASCGGNFCSRHRLMEQHDCVGLQTCKQELHERNATRLREMVVRSPFT